MALETLEILNGIYSIIFIIISLIIGLKILLKYFTSKNKLFIFIGLSWIGISEPWWPAGVSFLIAISTGTNGLLNNPKLYFLLGNIFLPIFLFFWMMGFTELVYKEKQKVIVGIFMIIEILFELFFVYFLITNPNIIGGLESPVDVDYKGFTAVHLTFILIVLLITGFLLAKLMLTSEIVENKLRGKFIAIAFLSFIIGAFMDAMLVLNFITLPIARLLLISCSIEFYIGWIFPNVIKNMFLKK
ncbi:MAG TPA: hypothetical protein VGB37_01330 [Candidatus Lokiarchaeia archaeon]